MSASVEASTRALGPLPGRSLEREAMLAVVATVAARPALWAPHTPAAGHERHYVSLHRDSHVDVWAIFWMPDNDTGWHDHDLSSGAVRVVRGSLVEHALRIGGDDLQVIHRAGGAFAFGPSHIHRLTCRERRSVSIHAYSPPLWRLGQYGVSPEGVLHRQSVSYADELRPLGALRKRVSPTLPAMPQATPIREARRMPSERLVVRVDGRQLTPAGVAAVACDGASVEMTREAIERNRAAAAAVAAILERGDPLYGVTTGVGVLRTREVEAAEWRHMPLRLLRSHAGGGGALLPPDVVRAAMVVRANQLGAGGAGVSPALVAALIRALNAGIVPAAHELGSLGTGDVGVLAEIALTLLGEGETLEAGGTAPAAQALRQAGLEAPLLDERDGIGFISSNAATIGQSALVAERAARVLDTALIVAALSFVAADADVGVLDVRVHAARPHAEQVEVAGRMRALIGDAESRRGANRRRPVHDPFGFRCQPQVDGPARAALARLQQVLGVELNAAAENALVVAADGVAIPNGNFHAGVLGLALDGLCAALAQSGSLVAARVGSLLDPTVTGLPTMLAERPGADSGAMVLEYTAHAAAAELRSLTVPSSAGYVSVSAGVEAHGGLAPQGVRRAATAVERMADAIAVELVTAVRALEFRGRQAAMGEEARLFLESTRRVVSGELRDRPLSGDVAAARRVVLE